MALLPTTLAQELRNAFDRPAPTPQAAARKLANAYMTYADAANANAAVPTFVGSAPLRVALVNALAETLYELIRNPRTASAAQYALTWQTALIALWTATTFQTPPFPAPPVDAGIPVPSIPGGVVFLADMEEIAAKYNSSFQASVDMADALDAYTRSFAVTLLPSNTLTSIT